MKSKKIAELVAVGMLMCIGLLPLAQAQGGDKIGGGGDSLEIRVNEIRSDILNWIQDGGADQLSFKNTDTNLSTYKTRMMIILAPHAVVVSFTDQRVIVSGEEKTCRGYSNQKVLHIKCNVSRFPVDETQQYRLIHHEFAGLARAEKNIGASSDYSISDQITKSLTKTTVLKLAVKKKTTHLSVIKECKVLKDGITADEIKFTESLDLWKKASMNTVEAANAYLANTNIDRSIVTNAEFREGIATGDLKRVAASYDNGRIAFARKCSSVEEYLDMPASTLLWKALNDKGIGVCVVIENPNSASKCQFKIKVNGNEYPAKNACYNLDQVTKQFAFVFNEGLCGI